MTAHLAVGFTGLPIHLAPLQYQQLAFQFPLFGLQGLVAASRLGLALELFKLFIQFISQIPDSVEIVLSMSNPDLGFPAAFLVFGDARSFLDGGAQGLGLGLDQARDHALFDNGVAARPQAGAQKQVGDVLAPTTGTVEIIVRLAVAVDLALDRDFIESRILSAQRSLAVVEHQFNGGLPHRFAGTGAIENDIGHGIAPQMLGGAFTHHPAHRIDDIGLATAIGPDNAHQVAPEQYRGGIHKRFEAGQLDLGKTH